VVAERPQRSRLIIGYAGISVLFVTLVRRPIAVGNRFDAGIVHAVRIAALEIWGLFIDDGSVALVAIAVLLAVTVFTERVTGQPGLAALLLAIGIAGSAGAGLTAARKQSRAIVHSESAGREAAEFSRSGQERQADPAPLR
jgi:hypothetical protein